MKYRALGKKPNVEDICVKENLVIECPIGCDLETIYHLANEENNPLGLRRKLCEGDVIQLDDKFYLVDNIGFTELS